MTILRFGEPGSLGYQIVWPSVDPSKSLLEVDAKTLSEGKHYRVCMELDETSSMGHLAELVCLVNVMDF